MIGVFWSKMSHSQYLFLIAGLLAVIALVLLTQLRRLNPIIHDAEQEAAREAA